MHLELLVELLAVLLGGRDARLGEHVLGHLDVGFLHLRRRLVVHGLVEEGLLHAEHAQEVVPPLLGVVGAEAEQGLDGVRREVVAAGLA